MTNNSKANPLWGGHFSKGQASIMEQINQSISFDKKLYAQDIRASQAHAAMLTEVGILTKEEGKAIQEGLAAIQKEIEQGSFVFKTELEDIHMNVEARLAELIGEKAGKLHTARSRNDQVAVDFRLWVRDAIDALEQALKKLQQALIERAEQEAETIMPGFTHLQTAQPVTFGHHLLAYVEMLGRDRSRFADCRKRMNECPLGAAALAGTSFPINREITAKALGFDRPTFNSLDSVSDRDFALEFLAASSLCSMHLSRFAEELVIWSSAGFRFIQMSESFTSGSSIMPQKRNPDAAELVRAKTGRIMGDFVALLTVMKGLVLTYSKDMQEDKEPVFETAETLMLCIAAMTGMVRDFAVNREAMLLAADQGFSTATDVADWLVKNLGYPFRKCHHITGKIVRLAEEKGCKLAELTLAELQSVEPGITEGIFTVLKVEKSVASRNSKGGTAPENVKNAVAEAKKRFL